MSETEAMLDMVYETMEGSEVAEAYSRRHGITSAAILTVFNDEMADGIAAVLRPRIEGKTVIEIGGGIGILAFHMAQYAKQVWCIEANPMWAWSFAEILLKQKPKNVSYLFGAADEFAGTIRGDVALFCTHSGVDAMRATAAMFAPVVIDFYGELIISNPEAFDPLARALRGNA